MDLFLWRGSPDPTLVQRVGAWIIGLFFALCGASIWDSIRDEEPIVAAVVLAATSLLVGAVIFRNGFRRRG